MQNGASTKDQFPTWLIYGASFLSLIYILWTQALPAFAALTRKESRLIYPNFRECISAVPTTSSASPCALGYAVDQALGKTRWNLAVARDPSFTNVYLISDSVDNITGRFELDCPTQELNLLSYQKSSDGDFRQFWSFFPASAGKLVFLPTEFSEQIKNLCFSPK